MMNVYRIIITLLICSVGFLQAQFAEDAVRITQDETGVGARAEAMGGAYVGLADDYSALYWNPAGLASVKKSQFFGEVTHLNFQNEVSFAEQLSDNSQNYTRLRTLGFALPLPVRRGSFVLGIGYNRVKDLDNTFLAAGNTSEDNGLEIDLDGTVFDFSGQEVQQTEQIDEEGGLDQWSLGFGMKVSPNASVGVTASVISGTSDYTSSFLQDDVNNNFADRIVFVNDPPPNDTTDFQSYQLNRLLQTDYTAVSLKVGGMVRLAPGVKLGATIGLPTTYTVNEIFTGGDIITYDDGVEDAIDFDASEFEYDVKTPFHFDAGASFSNRQLTLSAGLRYRDWSQTRFEVDGFELANSDRVALQQENDIIRDTYRATTEMHFGGEIKAPRGRTALRVGFSVLPDPREDMPSEFDKRFITLGLGFAVDRNVRMDITYRRGSWEQESQGELTSESAFENVETNKFAVGLTYNFR
ncbi:MAG: OmpP1/FadL family transporter [Calditrichia bacterium]